MTNSKQLRVNSHGLKLIIIILVLAGCGYAFGPVRSTPKFTRDWTKHPAVIEVDKPPGEIFAVGDPHAHYQRLLRVLMGAGLMDLTIIPGEEAKAKWLGGNAVLVVTGDMIDKNPTGSLKVINLLRALQTDAARKGGQVIVTMGNHEAEFLSKKDEFKKKTKDFRDELTAASQQNPDLNPDRVANCEGELGQWLCQLPFAARVGEWFFSHAGYTNNRNIPTITSDIVNDFNAHGFAAEQLIGRQSILEAGLDETGPDGFEWFYNGRKKNSPQAILETFTKTLGVRHIVQGHKPGNVNFGNNLKRTRGEMFQAYGLLFLIDADMGEGPDNSNDDNNGAALRIRVTGVGAASDADTQPPCVSITTQAVAVYKTGAQKTLWEETKRVRAYSGEPCN